MSRKPINPTNFSVSSYLACWLNQTDKKVFANCDSKLLSELSTENLRIRETSNAEKRLRKVFYLLFLTMSPDIRRIFSKLIKILRLWLKPNRSLPETAPLRQSPWHQAIVSLQKKSKNDSLSDADNSFKKGLMIGKICLTHDVDTLDCLKAVPELIKLESKYGITSTYHFLTDWEYPYDAEIVRRLIDSGFEIGLHGSTHDIAIGFRSRSAIKDHIARAMEKMEIPVKGYRAPAFAVSEILLEVLEDLNFRYDSSVLSWHPYRPSIGLSFPYQYPAFTLWEIPVTIEDAMLFNDLRFSERRAILFTINTMQDVCDLKGVCTVNVHPRYAVRYAHFFKTLLESIRELSKYAMITTLLGAVEDQIKSRQEKRESLGTCQNNELM